MTIDNLEKELKQGKLNSLYLLYGEEQYLLDNNVKKIKSLFGNYEKGINYIKIDAQNVMNIISDVETPSFGYEKKLIIARNTGLFKNEGKKKNVEISNLRDKLAQYISENMEIIDDSVVLVFVESDIDARLSIFKTIDKQGVTCKFDFQRTPQIASRMKVVCDAYKVNIDGSTMSYFIESCGTNMQELINEIRKLIEYAGPGGTIKKEDIDKLSTKKLESIIFDLTDNLGKKQIAKAMEILNDLIYKKEPIELIMVVLYNHFKKLYLCKIALSSGKDIVTALKLKPNQTFLVNKYKMQSNSFVERDLRNILQDLINLDYEYKIGLIDNKVGLDTILCKYCS